MLAVMGKQDEMLRSFGRRFQLLRQEKDLSQTAIAAMLQSYGVNITASHLSLVEKNKRNVSIDLLVALARLLETSTDYLLVLTDDPTPADKKGRCAVHQSGSRRHGTAHRLTAARDTADAASRRSRLGTA